MSEGKFIWQPGDMVDVSPGMPRNPTSKGSGGRGSSDDRRLAPKKPVVGGQKGQQTTSLPAGRGEKHTNRPAGKGDKGAPHDPPGG